MSKPSMILCPSVVRLNLVLNSSIRPYWFRMQALLELCPAIAERLLDVQPLSRFLSPMPGHDGTFLQLAVCRPSRPCTQKGGHSQFSSGDFPGPASSGSQPGAGPHPTE